MKKSLHLEKQEKQDRCDNIIISASELESISIDDLQYMPRVFCKESNEMIYPTDDRVKYFNALVKSFMPNSGYISMQCVKCRDNNGTLFYEGDRLFYNDDDIEIGVIKYNPKEMCYMVEWEVYGEEYNGLYYETGVSDYAEPMNMYKLDGMKIFDNIYQPKTSMEEIVEEIHKEMENAQW